jgi:type I restriction enzyme S subunit
MGAEWAKVRLSELTDPDTPVTYGVVKPGPRDPDGVLFIRGGDITDGRVLTGQLRTITNEVSAQYNRTLLRGGEIVVSLVGNPGQVAMVPDSLKGANIARQVGLVRLRGDVESRFVKYFLGSRLGQEALGAQSLGSVQQVINLRDLKTVLVPTPPLPEQRAIAHILGTLDDKIELNRQMSETLEGLARALFKSWFVDFDPVLAKMDGRWRPGEFLPGLPADLYDLFPDRLVESDVGKVPQGWQVGNVSDVFDLNAGQSPPGESYNEDGIGEPFYQGRRDFGVRFPSRRVYCTDPKRFADEGDTLVSVRAPVGDVNQAWERCCVGRGLAAVRARKRAPSYTYYAMVHLKRAFEVFEGSGSVFGSISQRNFKALRYTNPGWESIERFEREVAPQDARLRTAWEECQTLEALRDALLPKLISGELRVADAERLVEQAS